jgi:hypothetical protein
VGSLEGGNSQPPIYDPRSALPHPTAPLAVLVLRFLYRVGQWLKAGMILGGRAVLALGIGGAGIHTADNNLALLEFARLLAAAGLCHGTQFRSPLGVLGVLWLKVLLELSLTLRLTVPISE